jgi:hypothetical protein
MDNMNFLNFAYDGKVGSGPTWQWYLNIYDNTFYPTNGPYEDCCYDYHAPIQTVFEENGVKTKSITMQEALGSQDKFVYVLTFRYLSRTVLNQHTQPNIPRDYNFFEHLPIGIISAVNSGRCILILNDALESNVYTNEFYQQLKRKILKASLDCSKVLLITGNPENSRSDFDIKLVFWQYFETAIRLCDRLYDSKFNHTRLNYQSISSVKKFLCLNRIPREVRFYFMYKIYQKGLRHEFNASLKKIDDIYEIVSDCNNAFINQIKDDACFLEMLKTLPWIIDSDKFESNHWAEMNFDFKSSSLIMITTETLFNVDPKNLFLTEKTFKPILLGMPFIVIGNPYILKRLKQLGYKTFSTLWDESYDEELNCQKRISMIIDLVENISTKYTNAELYNLIEENQHIIIHNYNLLKSRRPEKDIINLITGKI